MLKKYTIIANVSKVTIKIKISLIACYHIFLSSNCLYPKYVFVPSDFRACVFLKLDGETRVEEGWVCGDVCEASFEEIESNVRWNLYEHAFVKLCPSIKSVNLHHLSVDSFALKTKQYTLIVLKHSNNVKP